MKTKAERRAKQEDWERRLNHEKHIRSPGYKLEQAAAQLAISLASDETVEPMLQTRIEAAGSDVEDPKGLLSDSELQFLPQADFVINAIKAAMDSLYEEKGHWVQRTFFH
jgi:hypothetical protein